MKETPRCGAQMMYIEEKRSDGQAYGDSGVKSLNYLIDTIIARIGGSIEDLTIVVVQPRSLSGPQYDSPLNTCSFRFHVELATYVDTTQLVSPSDVCCRKRICSRQDFDPTRSPIAVKKLSLSGLSLVFCFKVSYVCHAHCRTLLFQF
jgi:hypothetical protein